MKKPSIPATGSLPQDLVRFIDPIKTNLEIITGARPGSAEIVKLAGTATLSEVITKVNELISRINQNG